MSTIIGYAAKAKGQALVPFEFQPPNLKKTEVRVSVTHCGVCYSDIQGIDNYYGITKYPFVPGHEIVGFVSETGSGVSDLKVGGRVGIGWQGRSCMKCEWCLQGQEQLCQDVAQNGSWEPYGGFSSSVVVDHKFAYPIPDGLPSEVAAVLLCAGISVYSPLKSHVGKRTQKIGIIGVGGLGHLAVQFAHALGYRVTAISSSQEKKDEALSFGADHFICSNDPATLMKMEYTFDLLLCTAHGQIKWEPLLDALKKNGKLIMVGFPNMNFTDFDTTDIVAHQLSIEGSFLGNRATMREMLSFAKEKNIKPWIELMPMSQVNEAIQRVKENKARYRIVLVNDPDDSSRKIKEDSI
jgi:uncharacterized zinc-type alcohol dehydrogenase-like protein